jgi:transcriptional regulator with XRE-family HTH domain
MGERIIQLRHRRHLTQQELADAAEVSVDLVRKLEQRQRSSARLSTLNQLARALDVPVGELLDTPRGLSIDAQDGKMFRLRRVFMGRIPDTRPGTQLELTAAVVRAWDLFFAARFGEMERALPVALASAYSAAQAMTGELRRQANISLAQLLHATSNLLGYVAHEDLATLALMRADALAAESGDELTRAAIKGSQSWLFVKNGMFDDAVSYADQAATEIEPRLSTATPRHISIWGELLCYAAFAASQVGDYSQARRYLRLCESAGSQLEDDYVSRPEASNMFGRTSAASFGVVNENAAEQPREALKLAAGSESCTGVPPVLRSRRLINVAHAQVENWDNVAAVSTLHRACSMAPEFIGHIALVHTLTGELLARRRKQRLNGLVGVARHIGVPV